ncbi:MAG: hypothetical protein IPJ65_25775 [Archangiaceae bacterium]|nr:hypothetical protein [Archangiaceae bacterium]
MNFRTYSTFLVATCLTLVACNQPVQVGEPPPPEINRLTALVTVQTRSDWTGGLALVLSDSYSNEISGVVPTGSCMSGKHEWKLNSSSSRGPRSVGERITLTAGSDSFPMPHTADNVYQFENNLPIQGDAVHVQWDGTSASDHPFDADAIELLSAPDVSAVSIEQGEPLSLSWTAQGGDSLDLAFIPAAGSPRPVVTCSFVDQGSAVVPAELVNQLTEGYDRVELSRVKVKKTLWYVEEDTYLGGGAHPTHGVVGISARSVLVPLTVRHKRVFVTSRTFTGNLKGQAASGLAGGDVLCQQSAEAAQLGGTWRALLSDKTAAASARIADVGPWYLLDDTTQVFSGRAALFAAQGPQVAISLTETGTRVTDAVWTGTLSSGSASTYDCDNWSDGTYNWYGSSGTPHGGVSSWTYGTSLPCSRSAHLYCLEQ